MKNKLLANPHFWLILIAAAGLIYLLALQLLVPNGSFFTGDSGLKALLTQNVASGNLGFDLKFNEPGWVKTLWGQGLFPYSEPYVYLIGGRYFITWPYVFSLVTAPFYAVLGFRGLFAIPFLSTLGIWIVFYFFCKKLDLGRWSIGIGSFLLVFAANLSLYSALYWEHTLAVFLSFAGLYCLVPKKGLLNLRIQDAVWGGVLTGLAVWFRPEQVFLVIFLSVIWFFSLIKNFWPGLMKFFGIDRISRYAGRTGWIYPLSSLLTLCLFGLTNWVIYHDFLGVHSVQVVNQQPLSDRILTFIGNLRLMTVGYYSLFVYTPLILLPFIYLMATWIKTGKVKQEGYWNLWYVFSLFFILGVAGLVPAGAGGRQWGPRFLLFLVPLLVVLLTWQLDGLLKAPADPGRRTSYIALGLVLVAGGIGIVQNPVRGSEFLAASYSQQGSTVAELRGEGEPVVAVSDQFLAQVFQPASNPNVIFLEADTEENLSRLSAALGEQNQHSFSYLCYSFDCKLFTLEQKSKQVEWEGKSYTLQVLKANAYGIYTIFDIWLSSR